jgi:integrase
MINQPPDDDGKRFRYEGEGATRRRIERQPSAVERLNDIRAADGRMLLPSKVRPHVLRRTFASLAFMTGRDSRWVIGHTDARLTLEVYAQVMQRKRIDYDLVWRLVRFRDESEQWPGRRRGPV